MRGPYLTPRVFSCTSTFSLARKCSPLDYLMVATRTEKSSKKAQAMGGHPFYNARRPNSRSQSPAPPDPEPLQSILPSTSAYSDPQPHTSELPGTQSPSVMHLPQIFFPSSTTPHDRDPIPVIPPESEIPDSGNSTRASLHMPSEVRYLASNEVPGHSAVCVVGG